MTDTMTAELVLTRYFAASPELVFDAWIGSGWGEWLPPRAATAKVVQIDPRVGGAYEVLMTMPDGRKVGASGRYERVDRPDHLVFTWVGTYSPETMTIDLRFASEGDGTRMTLTQTGFAEQGMRNGYDQGWNGPGGSFDKLARILSGGA